MTKRLLAAATIGLVLLVAFFLFRESRVSDPMEEIPVAVALDEYGIPADLYRRVDATVRRNQTFSDLLKPYSISYQKIVDLARASRPAFDVRKLNYNRPYRIYLNDSLDVPEKLVYEKDRASYVVFEMGDSLHARVEEREQSVRTRTITGVITGSLYQTLVDHNASPALANRLSEVFAWQIDFYRIQRGDFFKIVYDQAYIADDPTDNVDVRAARFNHVGIDYFAFHYADLDEHFDENGESLRKAFLMAPVEFSRISSGWTTRRFHPVQRRYKAHLGTDYVAPQGTPIRATGDGVIAEAGYTRGNGNYVKIRHNGTYSTGYLHMVRTASGIRRGVRVRQGQVIGYVGHTGLATGDHVCYRFWKNGYQVNHRREKFPSVGPVPPEHRGAFEKLRDRYLVELNSLTDIPFAPAYAMLFQQQLSGPAGP